MVSDAVRVAVLAGGCFWCTEAVFSSLKGVRRVTPGYTGGRTADPTYEQVSAGVTGHAEALRIEYDPRAVSYDDLLTVFFATHDPTTKNRQGNDVGTQYRSAIFYASDGERRAAEAFIRRLNDSGPRVVTEVSPLGAFYEAEAYHRDYYRKNRAKPYCEIVISPKLALLQERFQSLLKHD